MHKRFFRMKAMMMKGFCGDEKGGHFAHPFTHMKEKMKEKVIKELDLNTEQQAKLEAIHETIKSLHAEKKSDCSEIHNGVLDQIRSEKLNESFMNDLMDHKHQMMKECKPVLFEKISDFHASLTSEQKEKLASRIEKCHGSMHHCHH